MLSMIMFSDYCFSVQKNYVYLKVFSMRKEMEAQIERDRKRYEEVSRQFELAQQQVMANLRNQFFEWKFIEDFKFTKTSPSVLKNVFEFY